MKIILIRHAESEGNVAGLINDNPARNIPLTGRGREQAASAADALRGIRFAHAYSSEFLRARQTAEILLGQQACALDTDARLNERISGMDGLPVSAFNDAMRIDPLHTKPVRGESFMEQVERLRGFLDGAAVLHPQGVVLAVSHENPILAALVAAGRDAERTVREHIANCEWVELVWGGRSRESGNPVI
jgi:broad specificity phosphatase PhoE